MQIHRRLSTAQVSGVLSQYLTHKMSLCEALQQLSMKKTQFFELLKRYRANPETFSIEYHRTGRKNITGQSEQAIRGELLKEKELIENRDIPVRHYNYSSIRDTLAENNICVSVPTIIARAKEIGCWQGRPPKAKHTREVLTDRIGELAQHDASIHRWSPYVQEKFCAVTTLDDCSRMLLFGDLFEQENSWVHICALESVASHFGVPAKYYTDSHRIFRFVQGRDSWYRVHTILTDDPQWKRVLLDCGSNVIYAHSPQGKGKIERPYQWMQDRVVRRCAKDRVVRFNEIREIFRSEVYRYNYKQVHSTTKEIPILRYERLSREKKSAFLPFHPQPPFAREDIFAFGTDRRVDGYQRISLHTAELAIPQVAPYQKVQLKLIPELEQQRTRIRIWCQDRLVAEHSISFHDLPFEKL